MNRTGSTVGGEKALAGKVALVTGASRGGARAIAVELGRAGATVYVTGRTGRGKASETGRPAETVEQTAELVTAAGGEGVAAVVDHLEADQVRALAECIDREQGRLDILVNAIWGGEHLVERGKKMWECDLDRRRTPTTTADHNPRARLSPTRSHAPLPGFRASHRTVRRRASHGRHDAARAGPTTWQRTPPL